MSDPAAERSIVRRAWQLRNWEKTCLGIQRKGELLWTGKGVDPHFGPTGLWLGQKGEERFSGILVLPFPLAFRAILPLGIRGCPAALFCCDSLGSGVLHLRMRRDV